MLLTDRSVNKNFPESYGFAANGQQASFPLCVLNLCRLMIRQEHVLRMRTSKRGQLLTKKLMLHGYNESRLKSSFRKFYGCYNDLVCDYKLSLAHILNDLFHTIC
jgi:hypothetical protein